MNSSSSRLRKPQDSMHHPQKNKFSLLDVDTKPDFMKAYVNAKRVRDNGQHHENEFSDLIGSIQELHRKRGLVRPFEKHVFNSLVALEEWNRQLDKDELFVQHILQQEEDEEIHQSTAFTKDKDSKYDITYDFDDTARMGACTDDERPATGWRSLPWCTSNNESLMSKPTSALSTRYSSLKKNRSQSVANSYNYIKKNKSVVDDENNMGSIMEILTEPPPSVRSLFNPSKLYKTDLNISFNPSAPSRPPRRYLHTTAPLRVRLGLPITKGLPTAVLGIVNRADEMLSKLPDALRPSSSHPTKIQKNKNESSLSRNDFSERIDKPSQGTFLNKHISSIQNEDIDINQHSQETNAWNQHQMPFDVQTNLYCAPKEPTDVDDVSNIYPYNDLCKSRLHNPKLLNASYPSINPLLVNFPSQHHLIKTSLREISVAIPSDPFYDVSPSNNERLSDSQYVTAKYDAFYIKDYLKSLNMNSSPSATLTSLRARTGGVRLAACISSYFIQSMKLSEEKLEQKANNKSLEVFYNNIDGMLKSSNVPHLSTLSHFFSTNQFHIINKSSHSFDATSMQRELYLVLKTLMFNPRSFLFNEIPVFKLDSQEHVGEKAIITCLQPPQIPSNNIGIMGTEKRTNLNISPPFVKNESQIHHRPPVQPGDHQGYNIMKSYVRKCGCQLECHRSQNYGLDINDGKLDSLSRAAVWLRNAGARLREDIQQNFGPENDLGVLQLEQTLTNNDVDGDEPTTIIPPKETHVFQKSSRNVGRQKTEANKVFSKNHVKYSMSNDIFSICKGGNGEERSLTFFSDLYNTEDSQCNVGHFFAEINCFLARSPYD